jgi:hypothetical protein
MKKKSDVPLIENTRLAPDSRTGVELTVDEVRRGLLNQSSISVEDQREWAHVRPEGDDDMAMETLRILKTQAQKVLLAVGLPTDHPFALKLVIENKCEPLSQEAVAAQLIDKTNALERLGDRDVVLLALQFASSLHDWQVSKAVNATHAYGKSMEGGRRKGPEMIAKNSEKARESARSAAEYLLQIAPVYRGKSPTAIAKVLLDRAKKGEPKFMVIAEISLSTIREYIKPMCGNGQSRTSSDKRKK